MLFVLVVVLAVGSYPASSHAAHIRAVGSESQGAPPLDKYLIAFEQIPTPNFGIITAIVRDDRGFLWFGTTNGLCKYNGYQIRVLRFGTPHEFRPLVGNQENVTDIIKSDDGSLLLATGKGLWKFNPRTEEAEPYLAGKEFSESRIEALLQGPDGTTWIGTRSQGLFGYNGGRKTLRHYSTKNGLSDDNITCLLLDRFGVLWFGTWSGGLYSLDRATSKLTRFSGESPGKGGKQEERASTGTLSPKRGESSGRLLSERVTALCEYDNGELWIGTGTGLDVLDSTRENIRRIEIPSPIPHTVASMARDRLGRMWIGVTELGLFSYSHGRLIQFATSNDFGHTLNFVRALYPDTAASTESNLLIWVGTRRTVNKVVISTNPFTNHGRTQDSLELGRGAVLSFCQEKSGMLWVGLWGGGLEGLRLVNGRYERVAHYEQVPSDRNSLPSNDANAVVEGRNGNLWIGTSGGLAMLNPERTQMVVDRHIRGDSTSLISNDIIGVYEDRSGVLWIYGRGGLSRLVEDGPSSLSRESNPHHFKNYFNGPSDAHPIEGNVVSYVFEDHQSALWVATYGKGLSRLEPNGTFTRFTHPEDTSGSQENFIFTCSEDKQGIFWLSTGVGLVSFDPASRQFRRHEIEQLHNGHIFGITSDNEDGLWLSTEIGLVRFNPKTMVFVRYDDKDGMPFKEFFSGFYRDPHGRFFVGGIDGFTEFSPGSVSTTSRPPAIAITSFSVFDEELSAARLAAPEIRLAYHQNFFSFSFAALDYANSLRNRFAYRMVGVDEHWVDAGTRNYAGYAHLDPGGYVFQVKGCNSDNVWNNTGASISIMITPPYWQTWWFRTLLAGIVIGAMYGTYRYRLKSLLEVERLRLRIADDLHDDVGSNLGTIAMVSRAIQKAPELTVATRKRLAEIYDTAISTSEGMRDIVWFIKPTDDTLSDLLLRMKDTASSLLTDIEHDFQTQKDDGSLKITIEFKRNFFLAFKEILANIAKHASATSVRIEISQRDGMLEAVIRDNGRGFDPGKAGEIRRGNGLRSMRSRAAIIGGVCEISSRPGEGTTARFSGKL